MNLQENIFKEFKENKAKQSEEVKVEETKEIVSKKKKRKKKKKIQTEMTTPALSEPIKTDLELFKEKLMENPNAKDFMEVLLPQYQASGFTDITIDGYVSLKMKHPKLRAFILNPSTEDLRIGKPGDIYFLKPLSIPEHTEFHTTVGPQNQYLNEFMDFCMEKCIVYPTMSKEDVELLTTGKKMSIYGTIMDISDLNKTFNIVEV